MKRARIKIRVDGDGKDETALGGNEILKRCVLSLERNIGREDEFRVSVGSEFQGRGPMQRKPFCRTFEMKRKSESEDLRETECRQHENYCKDM